MKLLPTIVAVAYAADLPAGTHDENCLFPNADFPAVFADPFSQFSFTEDAVAEESYGSLYPEGTTVSYQFLLFGRPDDSEGSIIQMNFRWFDNVQ